MDSGSKVIGMAMVHSRMRKMCHGVLRKRVKGGKGESKDRFDRIEYAD